MASQSEYKDLLTKIKALKAQVAANRKDINKNKKTLTDLLKNLSDKCEKVIKFFAKLMSKGGSLH